jgi:hypothetical protein
MSDRSNGDIEEAARNELWAALTTTPATATATVTPMTARWLGATS